MTGPDSPFEEAPRRRLRGRILIQSGGALVTVIWWELLAFAFSFYEWGLAVCGTPTPAETHAYRAAMLKCTLVGAVAPFAVGVIVHHFGERSWPWFALTAIVCIAAVVWGLSAHATQSCF